MPGRKKSGFKAFLTLLVFVGALAGGAYFYRDLLRGTKLGAMVGLGQTTQQKDVYYCPMHPDYKSDKAGDCPICNMRLVKREPAAEPPAVPQKDVYYCPMHPDYKSNKAGDCPICNMRLVKREPAAQPSGTEKPAAGRKILYWVDPMNPSHRSDQPGKAPDGMDLVPVYAEAETPAGSLPAGTVAISPQKQQLIGVQLGEVSEQPLTRTLITVGQLTYDATKIARIQTRFDGWIERVYVDFTGKRVKKGEPVISVYSPELVSTQQELLIAKRAMDSLGNSPIPEIAGNARSLYQSTRERLRLWDISEGQIRDIEKRGAPINTLTLFSPIEGFVLSRNAFRGQRVTPEMELYTIADLSTIWVLAEIYEYEIPLIRLGQTATMTFPYFPGEAFKGKVTYIYPQLDNATRTLKIRLEFPNPEFRLKPDMYANVALTIDYGKQLSVVDSAVLDSGTEQIVFIARADGHFEPRKVRLGAKVDDRYIVLGGLQPGETVVTSGNFLIDSESQLKSALGAMGGGDHDHQR